MPNVMESIKVHDAHSFFLHLPLTVQVGHPTVASSTLLEEFAILFSSAMQRQPQREDFEKLFTTGAMSHTSRDQISIALNAFAIESAQFILSRLLSDLPGRISVTERQIILGQAWEDTLGLKASKELEETRKKAEEAQKKADEEAEKARIQAQEEAKKQAEEAQRQADGAAKKQAEAEAQKKADDEAKRQAQEEATRKAAEDAKKKAAEDTKAAAEAEAARAAQEAAQKTKVGEKVHDKKIIALLDKVGTCSSGYPWVREGNGFVCGGGGHKVSDAQLAQLNG